MPAAQGVHAAAPAAAEKEPATQTAHAAADLAPVAVEKKPAAHGVQVDWAAAAQEPGAQAAQVVAPVEAALPV